MDLGCFIINFWILINQKWTWGNCIIRFQLWTNGSIIKSGLGVFYYQFLNIDKWIHNQKWTWGISAIRFQLWTNGSIIKSGLGVGVLTLIFEIAKQHLQLLQKTFIIIQCLLNSWAITSRDEIEQYKVNNCLAR